MVNARAKYGDPEYPSGSHAVWDAMEKLEKVERLSLDLLRSIAKTRQDLILMAERLEHAGQR